MVKCGRRVVDVCLQRVAALKWTTTTPRRPTAQKWLTIASGTEAKIPGTIIPRGAIIGTTDGVETKNTTAKERGGNIITE